MRDANGGGGGGGQPVGYGLILTDWAGRAAITTQTRPIQGYNVVSHHIPVKVNWLRSRPKVGRVIRQLA